MNRTQKSAWFGVIVPCFPIAWFLCAGILTNSLLLYLMPVVVFLILAPAVMFIVLGKKQSPTEVATDERDYMIRTKAMLAGFISVFVMLAVMCSTMILLSNDKTMVDAYMTIPFSVLIFIISIAVYSIAILVQYGREVKS
jgi:hypothetical protein